MPKDVAAMAKDKAAADIQAMAVLIEAQKAKFCREGNDVMQEVCDREIKLLQGFSFGLKI